MDAISSRIIRVSPRGILARNKRFLLMYYPNLRSLDEVDTLPINEFNLRVECIRERLGVAEAPEEETQPIMKRSLVEVLMEEQIKRNQGIFETS